MTPNIGYPSCGPCGPLERGNCEKSCNSNCYSDYTGCKSTCEPVLSPCGQNLNPYPVNVNCAAPYDPYWPNNPCCDYDCNTKSDHVVQEITENQKTKAS